MTREEQIIKIGAQFAIDETDGQTSGRAASMRGVLLSAFRAGAHWADSYPNWISVEDELPEHNEEDNGLISYPTVLVCLYDGFRTEDYYDDISGEWRDFDGDVEYWMPMPQPPRKEDKE